MSVASIAEGSEAGVDMDSLPYRNLTHFNLNCKDPLQFQSGMDLA
jgi:hypothetical protein